MIWMAVTPDELELPLAVEETAEKLGEKLGTTKNNVISRYRKATSGKNSGYRIVRIEDGPDDICREN